MRKTREEKAITLIALIITIVVLLILAVVAINAVTGDGIIQHAVNAKTSYEEAQAKENGILAYYEQYLTTQSGNGPWKQEENEIYMTNEEGKKVELQIGDKVEYNEGTGKTTDVVSDFVMKDLEWRVLGINSKGQLELISTEATDSTLTLGGEDGYLNGPTKLDKICSDLYSTEIATARSLNMEDINKIAGITEEDKLQLDGGYGYGTWWRYKFDVTTQKIVYSKSENYNPQTKEGDWTQYEASVPNSQGEYIFKQPGKKVIDSNNTIDIAELKITRYNYNILEEIPESRTAYDGKLISELILGDVLKDESGNVIVQGLASTVTICVANGAQWEILGIGTTKVLFGTITSSLGGNWDKNLRVRPVVTLNSNITLTKGNVDGEWKIESVNK